MLQCGTTVRGSTVDVEPSADGKGHEQWYTFDAAENGTVEWNEHADRCVILPTVCKLGEVCKYGEVCEFSEVCRNTSCTPESSLLSLGGVQK